MIQSVVSRIVLACVLSALPPSVAASSRTTHIGSAPVGQPSVVVVVTSKLEADDAGPVEDLVRKAIDDGLRARGLSPAERPTTRLNVEIGWTDEARDGYVLRYDARSIGEPATVRTSACPRCGSDALLEVIDTDLDALRPALAVTSAPAPEPTVTPTPTSPSESPARHRKSRIGPMGIAGASMLGVGFAALVPGIVLTALGDSTRVDPDDDLSVEVTNRRTPGLVLVGVGAASMIVGAALLGVDLRRRSKVNESGGRTRKRVHVGALGLCVRW